MSSLLFLPPEIRREILTQVLAPGPKLHLYLQNKNPCVSPCLGANVGDETLLERAPSSDVDLASVARDGAWAKRMKSSWGNHYRCEEVRDGTPAADVPVWETRGYTHVLLVCRQIWSECVDIIGSTMEVTVTDIDAASYFANLAAESPDTSAADSPSVPRTLLRLARSLNISMHKSRDFYSAFALPDSVAHVWAPPEYIAPHLPDPHHAEAVIDHIFEARQWRQLWPALAALPRPPRVTLWLDASADAWSDTNERAMLSPLLDAVGVLHVDVHLPHIPPDAHRSEKNLIATDAPQPAARVHRSIRRPAETHIIGGHAEVKIHWREYWTRGGFMMLRVDQPPWVPLTGWST